MKASRFVSVGLVIAAAAWVGSGYLMPKTGHEVTAAIQPQEEPAKLFRVLVAETEPQPHSRKLILSGRTEADQKVMAVARTSGIVADINVRRGDRVEKSDVIATLADEAREAEVAKAAALVEQRKAELEARRKLVEKGTLPKLNLVDLEAQYRSAQATLAAAEAERDRSLVTAPWSGTIDVIPTKIGQGVSPGTEIAQIISLDPMLAVAEVSERDLAHLQLGAPADVRLVGGQTASGKITFVSKMASPTTRTYRVEVELANPDGSIPDGITAEISFQLASVMASRTPRSALTFSSAGDLGLRTVDAEGVVGFVPVSVVEDGQQYVWVSGIDKATNVIVQGQDFVREGQTVEPVVDMTLHTATVK
jgi:membrane fusion protein, multidrug efflux system